MKYVLAALAVVAAIAALMVRPPWSATPPAAAIVDATPPPRRLPMVGSDSERRSAHGANVVYIAGEVKSPGIYRVPVGARVEAVLARAGGPTSDADLVAVNLAARLADGEEVVIPPIGAVAERPRRASRTPRGRSPHGARRHRRRHAAVAVSDADTNDADPTSAAGDDSDAAPPAHSIDLNVANAEQLETLPGVGPALAERIVAYRESNGPFVSVDELGDISGITPRLADTIADFVVVR